MINIISELRSIVNTNHAAIVKAQNEAAEFQERYSKIYVQDAFNREMSAYTARTEAAVRDGNAAVKKAVDDFIDSIKDIDNLEGGKLTDDVKLLESPVKLNKADLTAMFDRAKADDNRTMMELIKRRCMRDGIVIERVFYAKTDIENAVKELAGYAYNSLPGGMYYDIIWSDDEKFRTIIPDALRDLYGIKKPYRYETSTQSAPDGGAPRL